MKAVFFGDSSAPLYGILHTDPDGASAGSGDGALLCAPAGQEYMRMHRAYRRLADLLSRTGRTVLRYDHPGLGDSAGSMREQTVDSWIQGAMQAREFLESRIEGTVDTIVGARIGCIVAAKATQTQSIKNLVLWEPRPKGADFVAEMMKVVEQGAHPRSNFVDDDGTLHFNGFPFSPGFQDSLARHSFADLTYDHVEQILAISSEEQGTLDGVTDALRTSNAKVAGEYVDGLRDWNTVDQIGGIFLPQAVLRKINEWVS